MKEIGKKEYRNKKKIERKKRKTIDISKQQYEKSRKKEERNKKTVIGIDEKERKDKR